MPEKPPKLDKSEKTDKSEKSDKSDKSKSSNDFSTPKSVTDSNAQPNDIVNRQNQSDCNEKQIINESASLNLNTNTEITSDKKKELEKTNCKSTVENENVTLPPICEDTKPIPNTDQPASESMNADESNDVQNSSHDSTDTNNIKTNSSSATTQPNSLSKSERKVFVPSNVTTERKPIEAAGIVIKKDYMPSPTKVIKVEKTRDDVTRVLNYDTEPNHIRNPSNVDAVVDVKLIETEQIKVEKPEPSIETEPNEIIVPVSKISDDKPPKTLNQNNHISENKENSIEKIEPPHKAKEPKIEFVLNNSIKSDTNISSEQKEKKSSAKDSHHYRSHHHSSKTSSSKSSSRRSSCSSTRECSRCYRRSKIKRVNVGVQCLKYGVPTSTMKPTSTPLKVAKTLTNDVDASLYSDLKYGKYFHIEVHTNGGASIVHMYQSEINSLSETEMEELTEEFFRVVFSEDESGSAHHVMGIVHDAAAYIPDLLEHMADNYSTLTVKAGVLGRNSDIETSTIAQYYEQVAKHYSQGTFRYGPLHQISLVGKVHEEVGGYFPDLLGRLEMNPFLQKVILSFYLFH